MAGASWQRGIELAELRRMTQPFIAQHKDLVFGAFGLTKERDVAAAAAEKQFYSLGEARAIGHVLKQPSRQKDFAQREVAMAPDRFFIKSFASANARDAVQLLGTLDEAHSHRPMWIEIFEEDQIARAAVQECGFEYEATKVMAGSEIKGLYSLRETADPMPPLPPEELATLTILNANQLNEANVVALRAEVGKFGRHFAQHYSGYNKGSSWTAFALRGYSDDPSDIIKPAEMSESWKREHPERMDAKPRWTSCADAFVHTKRVVESLGFGLDRVRFMRLRAGDGELTRHADITHRDAGVQDGFLARLHIPLRTSNKVRFRSWDARGNCTEEYLPPGCMAYLDQRKPHAVINGDPDLERIHLVLDAVSNKALRKLIAQSYSET